MSAEFAAMLNWPFSEAVTIDFPSCPNTDLTSRWFRLLLLPLLLFWGLYV